MNPTDTQEATVTGTNEHILVGLGMKPAPRTAEQPATAQEPAPQDANTGADIAAAEAPTAESVKAEAAGAKPEVPAAAVEAVAAEVPAEVDPMADVVAGMVPSATPKIEATEDAKSYIKSVLGVDDLSAYKTDMETKLTAADLAKAEYDKARPLIDGLNSLSPALQGAFAMAMQGKMAEAQEYLRSLPGAVFENKPSSEIPVKDLVEQYFPGKIKPEQWEALEDPEADEELKEVLTKRLEAYKEAAAEKHDKQLSDIANQHKTQAEADAARYEQYKTAVAATITQAQSTSIGKLLDQGTKEKLADGSFLSAFVEKDGVTPTKDAATLYLLAMNGQRLIQAADASGYKRGKEEGMLATTQRQPSLPPGGRTVGDPPKQETAADEVNKVLFGALTSN